MLSSIFFVVQGYIVLNRPWAFVQWLEKADIEEEYVSQFSFSRTFMLSINEI